MIITFNRWQFKIILFYKFLNLLKMEITEPSSSFKKTYFFKRILDRFKSNFFLTLKSSWDLEISPTFSDIFW